MDNLFDALNNKMFSVLSHGDMRANYDLLSTIYDFLENKISVSREELVNHLIDYIKNRDFDKLENEEGDSIVEKNSRDIASQKIRQFKKCGWLEEDSGPGFTTIYSLTSNALALFNAFKSILQNNNSPLEYTGYFYVIYNILSNFDINKSKALLEQVFKNTKELFSSLQGLNSSIKHFIEEMIKNDKLSPQEILDTFLYKYQEQVMLKVFNNLKNKDNPNLYTDKIIAKAKELRYEKIDKVVENYFISMNEPNPPKERYEEIYNLVITNLDKVISRFEYVDEFVSIIDERNTKFHSTTIAKLEFLMNSRRDVEGLIINALKSLKYVEDNEDLSNIINIFSTQEIDDKSLYSYTFNKEKVTYVEADIPDVSDEEIEAEKEKIFADNMFSKNKINEYAMLLLEGNDKINSKDIDIVNFTTIIKMVMIQIYSCYDDVDYEVDFLEDEYTKFGYLMKSFNLKRRT